MTTLAIFKGGHAGFGRQGFEAHSPLDVFDTFP